MALNNSVDVLRASAVLTPEFYTMPSTSYVHFVIWPEYYEEHNREYHVSETLRCMYARVHQNARFLVIDLSGS